ncbi:MAG TPA: hypothetical protein VGZ25_11515 [Gemmataceae bacterium]|nr:hypothetical protein [Gemmataceae bacterium]
MARWSDEADDWGDESESDESEIDESDDEDDEPTIACPYCRKQIHEDSQRCPYCERYISDEDSPPSRKPWWIIIGAAACLYAIYRWIAM